MTSPDPVPLPPGPLAEIVTTEGTTWLATLVTAHALTAGLSEVALAPGELVVQPPTTDAAASATNGSQRRERRACFDPLTPAPHPCR